jgi:hypothetical protein
MGKMSLSVYKEEMEEELKSDAGWLFSATG